MEEYRYCPLDTQTPSFRLLRLRKGHTFRIECDIFHATLSGDSVVPFEALSYTWGSTELVDNIEVNNQKLWVTESLHSALLCLRSHHQDRTLWIDAICINQSDKEEQGQQVMHMGRIFSRATRVIFWLGKATVEVTDLMESLKRLQTKSVIRSQGNQKADSTMWEKAWSADQATWKSENESRSIRLRRGLEALLRRPWFERVWILQEVFNAQSAVVCSGDLSVSAHIFALSPSLLDVRPEMHVQAVMDLMPDPSKINHQINQGRDDLMTLCTKFGASKATDTRDMIFALLGMSSDPLDHRLLSPDYTKSLHEVVHNTVRYWLEATMVTISEVLDLLTNFKTVRTTYLLEREYGASGRSVLRSRNSRTKIRSLLGSRDASLFLLEDLEEYNTKQDPFHTELDHVKTHFLAKQLRKMNCYKLGFQVFSWSDTRQNVDILVLYDAKTALQFLGSKNYKQMFGFIASQCTKNKQELLCIVLIQAVQEDDLNTVQLSLDEGADVNARCGHPFLTNSLRLAMWDGFLSMVQLLLKYGADVNARGGDMSSTLQVAVASTISNDESIALAIVKLLLQEGADINAQGDMGASLLETALQNGASDIIEVLLAAGAEYDGLDGDSRRAIRALNRCNRKRKSLSLPDIDDDNGKTRRGWPKRRAVYISPQERQNG